LMSQEVETYAPDIGYRVDDRSTKDGQTRTWMHIGTCDWSDLSLGGYPTTQSAKNSGRASRRGNDPRVSCDGLDHCQESSFQRTRNYAIPLWWTDGHAVRTEPAAKTITFASTKPTTLIGELFNDESCHLARSNRVLSCPL